MEIKTDEDGYLDESNGEVGEFWSDKFQDSVLAHPDCLPNGIDDAYMNPNAEWKPA
jgi:hypothetical protein